MVYYFTHFKYQLIYKCLLFVNKKVGQVARIEPESDDESDQGMGSECDTSDGSEHLTETTRTTKETECKSLKS